MSAMHLTPTLTNTNPALRAFWHPVAAAADIGDQPTRVMLVGEPWVVVRMRGEVVAMVDRCPHRRVPLSAGRVIDGELQCAYHGYRFDGAGVCVGIPALESGSTIPSRACVATAAVTERFGLVWIAPETPRAALLDDAPYRDPAFDTFVSGPFHTRVGASTLTDNFLDATHFPFLHRATFGADDDGRPRLEVFRDGWLLFQRTGNRGTAPQADGPIDMHYDYVVAAPFAVALTNTGPGIGTNVIWSFCQPETETRSTWWLVHAYDDLGHDPALIRAATDFQTRVGEEDLGILELMDDPNVPLDLPAEIHTKGDLGTVEYRRMLRELVALTPSEPAVTAP